MTLSSLRRRDSADLLLNSTTTNAESVLASNHLSQSRFGGTVKTSSLSSFHPTISLSSFHRAQNHELVGSVLGVCGNWCPVLTCTASGVSHIPGSPAGFTARYLRGGCVDPTPLHQKFFSGRIIQHTVYLCHESTRRCVDSGDLYQYLLYPFSSYPRWSRWTL
jgi:hypothetical protein